MARTLLTRTAAVVLTAAAALTAGVATAGAAAADLEPGHFADLPSTSQAASNSQANQYSVVMTETLGRKLK